MFKQIALTLLVVVGLAPVLATAQIHDVASYGNSDLTQRLESLEAELASLRSIGDTSSSCSAGCSDSSCSRACSSDCGWYAGVDLVFAKPYTEDGIQAGDPSYDFSLAPRYILGYNTGRNFGIRARYWGFDDKSSIADGTGGDAAGDQLRLRLSVVDLELTHDISWGCVQGEIFGGVRYADIEQRLIAGGTTRMQVDGWGPTLGVDTLIPLTCRTSLVGGLRYSAMFGDSFGDGTYRNDKSFGILDAQLGLQWQRGLGCGTLRLRGVVETQLWMSALDNTVGSNAADEDLAMLGFVFGVEFLR